MAHLSPRPRAALMAALIAPALAVVTACGGGSSAAPNDGGPPTDAPLADQLPAKIREAGELTVASNIEYPPFESYDKDNKTVLGIDRDIADELEKQLGITITFENSSFDAIIPGLAANRYQMAMSAMTDTRERQKEVDFVDYFKAGGGIMTRSEDKETYQQLDDLCGHKVGIVKGTTEIAHAKAQQKKCSAAGAPAIAVTVFPGQNQTVLALQTSRVDAVLMDSAPGGYAAQQAGTLHMSAPYQSQPFGIVFAKGTGQLHKAVQRAMVQIKKSGRYQEILDSYGLGSGAIGSFTVNGGTE